MLEYEHEHRFAVHDHDEEIAYGIFQWKVMTWIF